MITSLRLIDFKNFTNETLRLGPFTVIIGANAACRHALYMVHCILKGAGWPTSRSHRKSR